MKNLLVVLFVLCSAVQAQAQSQLKTFETGEDSRGWEAVGRLDFGGRSFCTGSLISPTLVLTAAHCLYDVDTHKKHKTSAIQFRAGWRNGYAQAYRGVKQFFVHPDFSNTGGSQNSRLLNDLALVELNEPVTGNGVLPFTTARQPRKGAKVGVVSYAHDRANSASLQEACEVLARQGGVIVTSCDVDYGSSGAPIFSISNGRAQIVSVVAAKANFHGEKVSVGTSVETALAPLLKMAGVRNTKRKRADATPFSTFISNLEYVAADLLD